MAVPVQVGRRHGGGERLAHAVEHQLDRGRPELAAAELAGAGLLAPGLQVVDLIETAVAIPPQGADDVTAEHAVVGGHEATLARLRWGATTYSRHAFFSSPRRYSGRGRVALRLLVQQVG